MSALSKRSLMIVMAGDNSTHEDNIRGDRNFDVWVIYYGKSDEIAARYQQSSDRFWRARGMKVELLRTIIARQVFFGERFDFGRFNYVFLPDDDIIIEGGAKELDRIFTLAASIGADMFQPGIANAFYTYPASRRISGSIGHRVTWVEIMMPAYSSEIFERAVIPAVHQMDFLISGWGIEVTIKRLAEAALRRPTRTFVIDDCSVIHSRPPGTNKSIHNRGFLEKFLIPQTNWVPDMSTWDIEGDGLARDTKADELESIFASKTDIEVGLEKYKWSLIIDQIQRSPTLRRRFRKATGIFRAWYRRLIPAKPTSRITPN